MAVEIRTERKGGVLVVAPSGRLDNESAADFELMTQEAVAAGERHLVLDLSGLSYMSNAGLRVMGSLAKSLKTPTTSLRVAGTPPSVRQVFDAAGIAMLFDMRADLRAALADHPAALGGGNALGEAVAGLLGVPAGNDGITTVPGADKLAEQAFGLLSGGGSGAAQQPRAARAMVEGTQVMKKITAPLAASAPPPPLPTGKPTAKAGSAAGEKVGFWARLFGRGKK